MHAHQAVRIWITVIIITIVTLVRQSGLPIIEQKQSAPVIGALAPLINGQPVQSDSASITLPDEQITIINFWATWCLPCEQEMPELQAFADSYPAVQVIGINSGEPPQIVESWLKERAITFPTIIDIDGSIYEQYQIIGQPTTFIVAADGIISHIFYGPVTEASLSGALTRKDS